MRKRGQILAENIMFIVLNLIFLTILILFVVSKTGNAASLEDKYSKQLALMIDAAEPGMKIHVNMEDAIDEAESNGINPSRIVFVSGNTVTVKLRDKGGHSYSFFNNVDVSAYKDSTKDEFVLTVNDYK